MNESLPLKNIQSFADRPTMMVRDGLWFEIAKKRTSIRLTAPCSQQRRETASSPAKENNRVRDFHSLYRR